MACAAPAFAHEGAAASLEANRPALPAIQVSADANREPGSKTVIDQQELERAGATGIADVIRYQPLVEAPGTMQGATKGANLNVDF